MDVDTMQTTRALTEHPELFLQEGARRKLIWFAQYMQPSFQPTPFHRAYYEVLDRFVKKQIKKLIIQAPPQHGKLIADNEVVLTPSGPKRHGDLRVGDYVFGRDGKPVRVLWVSPKDRTQYRVTFSDGQSIDCHGAHEWLVYDRYKHDKECILETRQLRELWTGRRGSRGSRAMYHVPAPVRLEFDAQPVPIDPYTFGAWLGDGKSSEPLIHIGQGDTEIVEKIPYGAHEQKGTTTRPFYFAELRHSLHPFYNNKHIPDAYVYNSADVRKQLIAGLIDTDGYVYPKNGRVVISNTNKAVVEGVAKILRSLGQIVTVAEFAPRISSSGVVGRKAVYQVSFNPSIPFPTVVPRKAITILKSQPRRAIVSVEPIDGEQGNCIEVEGGLYLVGENAVLTHNSQGSSRFVPADILGYFPDTKVCICSYAATIAKDFNRDVQRLIDSEEYRALFPDTCLNGSNVVTVADNYLRNSDVFEIVGHTGSLRVVGRGGSLTSKTVDVMIYDDLYKDAQEANSPIVRAAAWDWFTKVAQTRLHNDSQELIVFTRWHPEDIIGKIIETKQVIVAEKWSDLENIPDGAWVLVNFEAIKTGEPTEIDPREKGEPLWPERHSLQRLLDQKETDPLGFQCLYQGNPGDATAFLYQPFKTWVEKSDWGQYVRSGCYIDVADEGDDFLCAMTYDIYKSENQIWNEHTKRFDPLLFALITDIEFTDESTEVTTVTIPRMINANGTQKAWIESNSGGAQFEKIVKTKVKAITVPFYQTENKESRIITNAPFVNQHIIMPFGWETRYPAFYKHITGFLRKFDANDHDDDCDCATGVYQKEIADGNTQPYAAANRGVRVH